MLAVATRDRKDAALGVLADSLLEHQDAVLAANATDIERGKQAQIATALLDRLALNPDRIAAMAAGLRELAALPDPIGEVVRGWDLSNGVHVDQLRVPFGVVGIIYEARPNVTTDAAGICLKSGNAALLRGSSSALASNRAIVAALRKGLETCGLPADCVSLVEGGREATTEMMQARGKIDLLIPRGGASLIDAVVRESQVPVIETGTGNCHLFVDMSADFDMALTIIRNAKTQRPSVCNALETLLVHSEIAAQFVPKAVEMLTESGVKLYGNSAAVALDTRIAPAAADSWDDEFLSLELRVAVLDDLDAAIAHIGAHTSGHSETIVTNNLDSKRIFVAKVDAACVLVNASSRFVDGGQFGFGAEIGISTQKLHARGPMALPEMTTTKYVITGDGQVRG
ncbi:MAG: glutamate-5-semialdehyde dehydrogenase [Propionibacteriaceae bacterium]|nr:glutamate-5-semialdehyde dehydrogenase [Propionibacteriaceae bacterium]